MEIYTWLVKLPYSHLYFNFGNYYMNLKQATEAAEMYFTGLETSPFRFSTEKKAAAPVPTAAQEEGVSFEPKFNSISCYAHTWSNLAVVFM